MAFKRLLSGILGLWIRYKGRPAALRKAIKKANQLCLQHKKRFRVYFLGGRYVALTRTQVQWKKHTGEWSRNVNMQRLEPMEYYDTLDGLSPTGMKAIKHKTR